MRTGKYTEVRKVRGKEVKVCTAQGIEVLGYVAHANRAKGITILALEDGRELSCINLEQIRCVWGWGEETVKWLLLYHEAFTYMLTGIQRGTIPHFVLHKRKGVHIPTQLMVGSAPICAFK